MKRYLRYILLIILVIVVIVYIADLFYYQGIRETRAEELAPVEIKEYEGERLSSIVDFRENSIKGPQYISPDDYRLTVTGKVNRTIEYTYEDVLSHFNHYSKVITLYCVEGWDVKLLWKGILVKDLLNESKPDLLADTIIFIAHDGYSTSFPLNYITENDILLAYEMNGVILPPERGFPFQLVAEDKWGYKWIKWVTRIELSNESDYRGYWERRGYSNSGNLNENFFD
ncbi:MAG: molybdopterin-dependent oxidoreductase [Methanomicrobiaceae archaeon]|nr:molybdopterin-dependent oxidoreductase [Methanomicrobiaceae archaeon]